MFVFKSLSAELQTSNSPL